MATKTSFQLSKHEKALFNICLAGDCLIMSTSFIQSEFSQKLDQELLMKALIFLQKRHPFLNTYIDNQLFKNRMYLKSHIDYNSDRICIEWFDLTLNKSIDRKKLVDESNKFYYKKIDSNDQNLLWKVQIIEYYEDQNLWYVMNLVVNMVISDGLSISCLSVELVNLINSIIDGKECDEMKIILDPVDSLTSLCHDLYKINKKMKKIEAKESKLVLPDKFKTNMKGFLLDFFKLDTSLTNKIIEKSKEKEIRLGGYFHTVVLYAMKKLYDENDINFPSKVPIEMAANMRMRLEPKVDLNACRFFTALLNFSTEQTKFGNFNDFWTDAKYIHELIQAYTDVETGDIFMFTHHKLLELFNQVFRINKSTNKACKIVKFLHPITCDLTISNLGRFVNDSVKELNGKFSIKEIYCSDLVTSVPKITSSILMHIIYWKGEIMFQMGANNYYMDEQYFQRLKHIIQDEIKSTINDI